MAIQKELWQEGIKEALFKANEFLTRARNEDEYVLQGKVVHIPQSGGPAAVERNRTTVPATAVKRTDTDITYVLDEYTTDPVLIPHADTVELSYDKRTSVIRENTANLVEVVANNALYNWAVNVPSLSKVDTTGGNNGAGFKKITETDLLNAQTLLNNQNVPKEGRVLLITSNMLRDMLSDATLRGYFQQVANLRAGTLPQLYGFEILERSSVLRATSLKVPKLPEAAPAGGDIDCALFWQRDMVARALGDVTMFDDMSNPLYYGDLYSFLIRFGGRAVRTDNKGVGLICQVAV